jgi:hypothetical protein
VLLTCGILSGASIASGCGSDQGFLYRLPDELPKQKLSVNVKEIRSGGKVDVLWVIDNSGSMRPHQQNVIANSGLFMQRFLTAGVDWKMGLISTDTTEAPFLGFATAFDRRTPDPVTVFQSAVGRLGTGGSGTEKPFQSILNAFSQPLPFNRGDSPLAVILVTDAEEQSQLSAAAFVTELKARIGSARTLLAYAVLPARDLANPPGARCDFDERSFDYAGSPYEGFLSATKVGRAYWLCDAAFGTNLGEIGRDIVEQVLRPRIRLAKRPRLETLRVLYQGAELASGAPEAGGIWYYDYEANTIEFYNLSFAPGQTESVEVLFEEDDGVRLAKPAGVSGWVEFDVSYESPHPYPSGSLLKPPLVVEGASALKVFFSRIDTEAKYDHVLLRDGAGVEISRYTGLIETGFWSPEIQGDRCSVVMFSDHSVQKWGFAVARVAALFE